MERASLRRSKCHLSLLGRLDIWMSIMKGVLIISKTSFSDNDRLQVNRGF